MAIMFFANSLSSLKFQIVCRLFPLQKQLNSFSFDVHFRIKSKALHSATIHG